MKVEYTFNLVNINYIIIIPTKSTKRNNIFLNQNIFPYYESPDVQTQTNWQDNLLSGYRNIVLCSGMTNKLR